MAGWVMDRRLQNCDSEELADLLHQLLALEHEGNVCSSLHARAHYVARMEEVIAAMGARGVQMRFFD